MKKIGLAILGLMLIIFLFMAYQNGKTPHVGIVNGQLTELKDRPNGVSSQTSFDEKRVDPFLAHEKSMAIIEKIIVEFRGLVVSKESNYVHVIFTTRAGFRDDVEFYIKENFVHYRSQSRVGYGDMNKNLERYLEIKDFYNQFLD